jgi:hypothetical protein
MSNPVWQRFPVTPGLHILEMKDALQTRVMEDTHGASSTEIISYFGKASRSFWREVGLDYPASAEKPATDLETPKTASGK